MLLYIHFHKTLSGNVKILVIIHKINNPIKNATTKEDSSIFSPL